MRSTYKQYGLNEKLISANKNYVAGWASMALNPDKSIYDAMPAYLKDKKVINQIKLNLPKVQRLKVNNRGIDLS